MSAPTCPWPQPNAWLIGWVDSALPGYNRVHINGTNYITLPVAYRLVTDAVAALHAEIAADGYEAEVLPDGRVRIAVTSPTPGAPVILTWYDRLGYLLGFDVEPQNWGWASDDPDISNGIVSTMMPPGIIGLMGADFDAIETRSDSEWEVARAGRGHGYVWEGAQVWRIKMMMGHHAVTALQTGWCLRGKVTVSPTLDPSEAGPWDATANPGGYVTGHVLGLDGPIHWLNDTRTVAEAVMLIVREPV